MVGVQPQRKVVKFLTERKGRSQRKSCELLGAHRSTIRYQSKSTSSTELLQRLKELAAERPRFGYRRLHYLLVKEGWQVNRKRILRLYREAGLQVRRKKRKQASKASRRPLQGAERRGQAWSIDFMADSLAGGRSFRLFTMVDNCTRECPSILVNTSLPANRLIRELDQLIEIQGKPEWITLDNGPEFRGWKFDRWAYLHGIDLRFIRPGKPMENGFIESFNGRLREECLNQHCFGDLEEARSIIEDWRLDYNERRPHSSLGNRPPSEYAASLQEAGYPASCTEQAAACTHLTPKP